MSVKLIIPPSFAYCVFLFHVLILAKLSCHKKNLANCLSSRMEINFIVMATLKNYIFSVVKAATICLHTSHQALTNLHLQLFVLLPSVTSVKYDLPAPAVP